LDILIQTRSKYICNQENPLIKRIGVQTKYIQLEVCKAAKPFIYIHRKSPLRCFYILRRRITEKKFRNVHFDNKYTCTFGKDFMYRRFFIDAGNKKLHFSAFFDINPLSEPRWPGFKDFPDCKYICNPANPLIGGIGVQTIYNGNFHNFMFHQNKPEVQYEHYHT
jgi:hypothetical protein